MVCGKEAQLLLKKGVLFAYHFIGLLPPLVHKVNGRTGDMMGSDIRDGKAYVN